MDVIEQALNTAYVDGVLAYDVASTGQAVTGRFVGQDGGVYHYQIDQQGVEFERSDADSAVLNDYFKGRLASIGLVYHGDNAFDYFKGRFDSDEKADARPVRCKAGGTPCGGRCLARGQKCRVGSSGASKAAMKNSGGMNLKDPATKRAYNRGVVGGVAGTLGTIAATNLIAGAAAYGVTRHAEKQQAKQK